MYYGSLRNNSFIKLSIILYNPSMDYSYRWNPDGDPVTRYLYCSNCRENTKQHGIHKGYNEVDFRCGSCDRSAHTINCYKCEDYTGNIRQPAIKHWSGVFKCGVYGHPYDRDTMCAGCSKWTHTLTPGGRGTVYCSGCSPRSSYRYNPQKFCGCRQCYHMVEEDEGLCVLCSEANCSWDNMFCNAKEGRYTEDGYE